MFLGNVKREVRVWLVRRVSRSQSRRRPTHLLVAVLHGVLQIPFGDAVFFQVNLLQMLYGCSVEVVQLRTKRRCRTETHRS